VKANNSIIYDMYIKIEWESILFFIMMFTLVYALQQTGIINLIGDGFMSVTKIPGISPVAVNIIFMLILIWLPLFATGLMSAVPMAMIMVPIVQSVMLKSANMNIIIDPDVWWALILGTCFGGNFTLVGAAANIVVGGMSDKLTVGRINFSNYMRYAFPFVIISGVIASGYILMKYLLF